MDKDNTEEDSVEIDLGSIGRRIGGFFGKKTQGIKATPEKAPVKEEAGNGEKAAEEKKDSMEPAGEKSPEDEYFELDLGGLFGRKKRREVQGTPSKKDEEKAAGPSHTVEAEKAAEDEIAIDFGKIFGSGKKEEAPDEKVSGQPPKQEKTSEKTEEEDSIEIDFGKLFGGRKDAGPAHPKKHHPSEESRHHGHVAPKEGGIPEEKRDDGAVEIDLGAIGTSITGLFGGKKGGEDAKARKKEEKEDEEYLQTMELDIDVIGRRIIKHKSLVVFILLAAIVSFSLYIRLLSAASPLSPDYDTYLHYRYARDTLNDGMQLPVWDEKSYYPPGRNRAVPGGYPLMEAYVYKFLLLLYPGITLINSAMVLTALFGGLAVIPAFFIGKDASGDLGGLFSAFLVGTVPAILSRSIGSYADTDAMVLFFSLVIVALYTKAVEAAKERLNVQLLGYSVLSGLAAVALLYSWGVTFEYVLQLLVLLPFLLLGIHVLSGQGRFSKRVGAGIMKTRYVFLATFVMVAIPFFAYGSFNTGESGIYQYKGAGSGVLYVKTAFLRMASNYLNPLGVAQIKSESGGVSGAGKNVYISVAEMQPPVLENYTSQFGVVLYLALLFFIAGVSLLLYRFVPEKSYGILTYALSFLLILAGIVVNRLAIMSPEMRGFIAKFFMLVGSLFFIAGVMKRSGAIGRVSGIFFENELQERALLLVLAWGGGLFFVSTLGIRFLALLGSPLCIAAGVLLDRSIKSAGRLYPKLSPFLLAGIFVVLVALFVPQAYGIGSGSRGSMDVQWHDMLVWIKLNSAPDATVTTWWDPGHWVTSIADRRSGADGAHYPGGPRPISVRIRDFGWSFTTTNETESVETLRPYLGNASEMFYISSSDLIGKFVWLSYFSTGTKQQYVILGESGSYPQNGATLHMYPLGENVVVVVRESGDELEPWLYVNNNKLRIREITYFDQNGQLQKQVYKDGEDAMVWMQGDKKVIVYMPGSIKDNVLTRTYFFGGEGLERFRLEFANQAIKLYKVLF